MRQNDEYTLRFGAFLYPEVVFSFRIEVQPRLKLPGGVVTATRMRYRVLKYHTDTLKGYLCR